jgi:hypothetical protein
MLTSRIALASAFIAASLLAGCSGPGGDPSRQVGANPYLPEQHHYLLPPMRIASVKRWGPGETPTAAPGLKIQALATGFEHPRQIYVLPNGDVLVVESSGPAAPVNRPKDLVMKIIESFGGGDAKGANRITLIREGADGAPALRTVFLDHLNSPFGVALIGNNFYVADTDAILRFPYVTGETSITAPGTKLTDLPGGPIDHHWTKSLVASPDGTKLYASVGSNSNITENGIGAELGRAAIWEVDPTTGMKRIFASGLRNPNSMQFDPTSGKMWAVINERDELGPDLVPDYLTSVKDGGFYGWPYSYYGQHVDPRVMPQRPDLVAKAIPPDYALSSHVAPLGLAFSPAASSFPAEFRGGVFVGEHGSWDRPAFNGYRVVFIPFANGMPDGPPRNVVTGFLNAQSQAQGRPVGVAIDHAGGLLVADDLGDTVWRVTPANAATATTAVPTPPAG